MGIILAGGMQGEADGSFASTAARDRCCARWAELTLGRELPVALANYADKVLGGITKEQAEFIRECSPHQVGLLRSFVLQMLNCPLPGGPGLGVEVGLLPTRFVSVVDPGVCPMITISVTKIPEAIVTFTVPNESI